MTMAQIEEFSNHIGGEWTRARSGETFDDVNPADTREIVGRFQASSAEDAQAALGLGMVALQACHVPHSDRDPGKVQSVADLQVDMLRLAIALERPIPVALLLVDDAEIDERSARVPEPAQLAVDLERALEVPAQLVGAHPSPLAGGGGRLGATPPFLPHPEAGRRCDST